MTARSILNDLTASHQDSESAAQARNVTLEELTKRLLAGETTGDKFIDMSILSGFGYGDGEYDGPALLRAFDEKLRAHAGQFVLSLVTERNHSNGCGVFGNRDRDDFPNPPSIMSARFALLNGEGLVPQSGDPKTYGIGVDCHAGQQRLRNTGALGPVEITEGPLFPDVVQYSPLHFLYLTTDSPFRFRFGGLLNDRVLYVGDEQIGNWIRESDGFFEPRAERYYWAGKALGKVPMHDSFVRYYLLHQRGGVADAIVKTEAAREKARTALASAQAALASLDMQIEELKTRQAELGTEDPNE